MKISEIIMEGVEDYSNIFHDLPPDNRRWATKTLPPLADRLLTDCTPFFQAIGYYLPPDRNWMMWRGTEQHGNIYEPRIVTPRKDRIPKDTFGNLHILLDEYFSKHYGFPYRSAGLFATGDLRETGHYGKPHAVFPIGEFKFLWSPEYPDLTDKLQLSTNSFLRKVYDEYELNSAKTGYEIDNRAVQFVSENPSILREFLDDGNYTDQNLQAAIKSGCEIMIQCSSAYVVPVAYTEDMMYYFSLIIQQKLREKGIAV